MRFNKLLLALLPCALWAQIGGSFLSGDLVRGGSALTTPGRVPTVSALGTLGQSDVSLASGIFSRAGTLGLSATGSNVVTFSTNGSERGRFDSAGLFGIGTTSAIAGMTIQTGSEAAPNTTANGALALGINVMLTAGTVSGVSNYGWIQGNHRSLAAVYYPIAMQPLGGNVLIGTTTDATGKVQIATTTAVALYATSSDADSQIQLNNSSAGGRRYSIGSGGSAAGAGAGFYLFDETSPGLVFKATSNRNVLFGGSSEGNYRLDVQSSGSTGTMRVYDQTATTGVTSLVVRAGAGQGSAYLTKVVDNANADKIFTQILSGQAVTTHYYDASNYSSWVQASGAMLFGTITDTAFTLIANNAEKIKLNNTGIGFFGVTPVARQTATADAASILALLQAYGLSN